MGTLNPHELILYFFDCFDFEIVTLMIKWRLEQATPQNP